MGTIENRAHRRKNKPAARYIDSVPDMRKAKVSVGVYDGSAPINKLTCSHKRERKAEQIRFDLIAQLMMAKKL